MHIFWLIALGIFALYFTIMFIIVQIKGNPTIAHCIWPGAVFIGTWFLFWWCSMWYRRQLLLISLITIWVLRLLGYHYARYTNNDPRFLALRQEGGASLFLMNLFYVFIVQGFLALIMLIPSYLTGCICVPGFTWFDRLGFIIWLIGFLFEAISDHQLWQFRRNPVNDGHVMNRGLWRYSRHPNYFGELLMWLGIAIILQSVPDGIYAFISPLVLLLFLVLFMIRLMEKALATNMEYQVYKRETSAFIPWFYKQEPTIQ